MSSSRTRRPLDQAAPPSPAPSAPLLYSREQLCEVLGISRATLDRLQSAGKVPRPLRLGGQRRWRAEVIHQWIAAGMPQAAEWEARQAAG